MTVRVGAAAAAVVLALLAGCSESDPPPTTSLPTTTASMPPTTSTSAKTSAPTTEVGAPILPSAADARTPEGAAAFISYWLATLEFSESIMDSAPFRSLDDGSCGSCNNLADTIDFVASEGNQLEGGLSTVRDVQTSNISQAGATAVDVIVDFSEQYVATPQGDRMVLNPPAPNAGLFFDLTWSSEQWRVNEVTIGG